MCQGVNVEGLEAYDFSLSFIVPFLCNDEPKHSLRQSHHFVQLALTGYRKPQQSAYIERYNRTVRHEWWR